MAKKKRTCPLFLGGYLSQGGFFMNVLFCPLFQQFHFVSKIFWIISVILSISRYINTKFLSIKIPNFRK